MCIARATAKMPVVRDPGLSGGEMTRSDDGTGDAVVRPTMKNISKMMTTKNLNTVLKGVIAAMPAIPYIMKPKRTPIAAYVAGGIGFALAGGLAALFFFSPKTRTRALTVAKDGYEKISHLKPVQGLLNGTVKHEEIANGFGGHSEFQPTSTGL